jgi:hypothetical protein
VTIETLRGFESLPLRCVHYVVEPHLRLHFSPQIDGGKFGKRRRMRALDPSDPAKHLGRFRGEFSADSQTPPRQVSAKCLRLVLSSKNGDTMTLRQKATGAGIGALLLAGGALAGSLINAGAASTTTASTPGASGAPAGSNTNPAHEAAESPAHAAAEASGKFRGHDGKFVPNTDPAHEKAESAAHAAQEAAGQFPTAP